MVEFSSPGRIEIVGNHTDHNHGEVLVAAIDLVTSARVQKTDTGVIFIDSRGFAEFEVDTADTSVRAAEAGTPQAIVRGVADGLKKHGYNTGGFAAAVCSNIPFGAGVSSSASFELLICQILNKLYNNSKIDRVTMAKIARYAENVYMNKPCGLLDQTGIALGGLTHIDFFDIENPKITSLSADFKGYKIVLTATGGDHSNLTSYYAAIKTEMEDAARFFNKKHLADVSAETFYLSLPDLANKISGRAVLRAAHFFEENARVQRAAQAILRHDYQAFFDAVKGSGESSYKFLQNCYAETDTVQRIPLALYLSSLALTKGAYRVHGGGFKGTILAFVHDSEFDGYIRLMGSVFGKENIYVTDIRNTGVV